MSQVNALQNADMHSEHPAFRQTAKGLPLKAAAEQSDAEFGTDKVSIREAVKKINAALTTLRRAERHFLIDKDLGRVVVKIINADTKELIRQIPTDEALALSKKMQKMIGLMFK